MFRPKILSRVLAVSSAAALGVIGTAAPAGAVTSGHVAGYVAAPSANPTQTVADEFVVPSINCAKVGSGGFQAVVLGVGLQIPGGNSTGGAAPFCPGPVATYVPIIQINGVSIGSGLTIHPGDTVSARLSEGPSGTTVTVTDGAQSQTASGPGGSATAEEVGDIAVNCNTSGCSPVPIARLTPFSNASIDGHNLFNAHSREQYLVDAAGATEMQGGPWTTKSFNSFNVRWIMSCSTGPGRC
jgi:hypothetical protein